MDFDAEMKRAWEGAKERIRANGEDPDEVIEQAAANLERIRTMDPGERQRLVEDVLRSELDWEMTVDDMGRPLTGTDP